MCKYRLETAFLMIFTKKNMILFVDGKVMECNRDKGRSSSCLPGSNTQQYILQRENAFGDCDASGQ